MTVQLSELLQEEIQAREWSDEHISCLIEDDIDRAAVFVAIYCGNEDLVLDEKTASVLDKVFGMSAGFFMRLEAGFIKNKHLYDITTPSTGK